MFTCDAKTQKMMHFYYGLMNSGKSARLICQYHAIKTSMPECKIGVFIVTFGNTGDYTFVPSRCPLVLAVNGTIRKDSNLISMCADYDMVILDEIQFATVGLIDQVRKLVDVHGKTVYCYGLLSDWRLDMFVGTRRCIELADSIESIASVENMCTICKKRRAIGHVKYAGNRDQFEIDTENLYRWSCFECHKI